MSAVIHIETISELNRALGQPPVGHPLVTIVDMSRMPDLPEPTTFTLGFYTVMLKDGCHHLFRYGWKKCDFQEAALFCIAPRQAITLETDPNQEKQPKGWGLFFHPDLIKGTSLGVTIKDHAFFSYQMNEALHLSEKEVQTLNDCLAGIAGELLGSIDRHSRTILANNIELLLNHCSRYYDRQFITRQVEHSDLLTRFEALLQAYFQSGEVTENGLPTVKYCADKLYLSPNYMSDLLKRETGLSAQEHIHKAFVEEARIKLLNPGTSVSEVAYALGFQYPQYFSRLFKAKTGVTPGEFISAN